MRITPSANAQAASGYHRTSLRRQGEYYKDEIQAFYQGGLAKRLGLHEVTLENFDALVNNKVPGANERLTPLSVENRRVGWDITTLPPKSFSILSALTDDPELEVAFKHANCEMMLECERMILAQANSQQNRYFESTSNGCWAEFHHKIGRPVEHNRGSDKVFAGQPLEHIHNFLISATYSKKRDKILAIDPYLIYKSAPYLQSYFHSILSHRLSEIGYSIERTSDAWEISGISRSVIERFSKRSSIINNLADEKNISDPKVKAQLAAKTRLSKNKSIPEHELLDLWKSQLTKQELEDLQKLKGKVRGKTEKINPKEAVDRSLSHFLQRNSVVEEKRVLGHALQLGFGTLLPEDVRSELNSRTNILKAEENAIPVLTTKEMVKAEDRMIELAISGKGQFRPLNPGHKIKREYLNTDQANAVKSILNTPDQVVALEGKAGAGKTTMLLELADGLAVVGKQLIPVAQSSQAVEVLRKEGFKDAQTIASFLIKPELQRQIHNNVLCVDEASLIGVETQSKLLSIAKKQNARVLLSGNIRQHSSPGEFGDALRILQQQAKVKTVHLQQNMRQKPEDYRQAVNLIAQRKTLEGYQVLDKKMKAVQEVPDHEERLNKISDDYLNSIRAKRSALIVSPTHVEGNQITQIVREKLKSEGRIKGEERTFQTLKDLSFSESQKKDTNVYQEGQVIRFIKNQKAKDSKSGFKAGSHYEVLPKSKEGEIRVKDFKSNRVLTLPHDKPEYYSVYRKTDMKIAVGDHIKPTVNLKSQQDTKINNGTPQIVKGFAGEHIKLANGKTLDKDSYHLAHNYVSTTHSAQGRTSQDVFISMSDASLGAVNEQAFYVAVSRARSRIQLYTSNKKELKTAIARSGERATARDIAKQHEQRLMQQRQHLDYKSRIKNKVEHAVSKQRRTETTRNISEQFQKSR